MARMVWIVFILVGTSPSVRAEKSTADLMRLIEEEERALFAVSAGKRWPGLYWKLMLLNMEKFRIVRTEENKALLAESPDAIAKKGRDHYFRRSLVFYKNIKKLGTFIVKKWPSFDHNDEIYYNLAAVTIERNNQGEIAREVEHYLKKSLELAKKGSIIYKRAITKLAGHYYHLKNYKRAAQYYLRVVKFEKKDKWHTRHLYNLAWSLMSIKKNAEARKYLGDSLLLSMKSKKNGRYVDYSDSVLDSLPLFIDEGNLEKSVQFFEGKFSLSSVESLSRAAGNAQGFGKYKLADYFLEKAFGMAYEAEGWAGAFDIVLKRLDFYQKIRRDQKIVNYVRHLAGRDVREKIFDNNQKRRLVERIKRHIRVLQDKSSAGETKKVLFHFDTLKMLDVGEKSAYWFYQGEVLYSQKKYLSALKHYRRALKGVVEGSVPRDKKIVVKIFDSMIKSLSESGMDGIRKKRWNKSIYTNHLTMYPVNPRSRKMYQKLYNIYYKEKNYKKCKGVLLAYGKNYPHRKDGVVVNKSDIKKQQFMISQIIDYYVKKENWIQASKEIEWLKKEQFAFDKQYIEKVTKIFNYKFFDSVGKEKNPVVRGESYKKIYANERFSPLVRSDSAWYVGEFFLKSQKFPEAVSWAEKSLDLLGEADGLKRQKNVLEMVVKMVHGQNFGSAEKLALDYFVRHCKHQYELKNDFYNATVLYALVEDKGYHYIVKNVERGYQCGIGKNVLWEKVKTVADFFKENERWDDFEKIYHNHGSKKTAKKYFKELFLDFYWEAFVAGDGDRKEDALAFLKEGDFSKDKDVAGVIGFHDFVERLAKKELYTYNLYNPENKFDEKLFNKTVEEQVVELNSFKRELEKHTSSGHPQMVIHGNWILYKKMMALGKALFKVVPTGVDDNYKKTFLRAMRQLGNKFLQEASNKKREVDKIIVRTDALPAIFYDRNGEVPFVLSWGR